MKQYIELLKDILDNGFDHEDRTGFGRRSVFSRDLRFNLADGFPLVTTRKVFVRGMITETLWFLTGSSRSTELTDADVHIWDAWTPTIEDADNFILDCCHKDMDFDSREIMSRVGTIGPMYGSVWRGKTKANGGDQLARLLKNLKERPYHSRHCVTAWIPSLLPLDELTPKQNVLAGRGALAPCHCFFQCFVSPPVDDGKMRLSLKVIIRSADVPVGTPYNVSQYALLLMIFAQCVDMVPHELIVSLGDAHIYLSQIELVKEQMKLEPRDLPNMVINPNKKDLGSFTIEDFVLENYDPHPVIKYPVAY